MRWPLPTIVLVALNVGLLGAVGMQLLQGSQRDKVLDSAVRQASSATLQFEVPSLAVDLEPIQSQVVFYKSRIFYVAPPAPAFEQPAPDYRLTGSMSLPNKPSLALLMHNQTKQRVKVAIGDQLDGWTVSDVGTKHVRLQLGERSAEIGTSTISAPGRVTSISGGQPTISPSSSVGMARIPVATDVSDDIVSAPSAMQSGNRPRPSRRPNHRQPD